MKLFRALLASLALAAPAHATITHVGDGAASFVVNGTDPGADLTPSLHASTANGDLAVCVYDHRARNTVPTVTGWTQIKPHTGAGWQSFTIWAKVVTGSSDGPTFDTTDTTVNATIGAQCTTFRTSTTWPSLASIVVESAQQNGATCSTTMPYPSITPSVNNLVVYVVGAKQESDGSGLFGVISGYTEFVDTGTGLGSNMTLKGDFQIQTTATALTGSNWSGGTTLSSCAGLAVTLKDNTVTPTFTSAPAIQSRTTSSITVRATSDTTGTIYGARYTDGGSAPTCDQLEAQTVTGAAQYCSVAATATVAADCVFSSITDGTLKDSAYCIEDGSGNDSAVATIADTYKTPAWTTAPSVTSQTSSAYTITKVLDGAGSCTAVACAKDATAPTVAQVLAGNCTGDVAAIATVTDASCEAGTATLGGSLTRYVHDVYVAGTYGSQNSALTTLADEMLDAAAGREIINGATGYTSIHANSPIAVTGGFNDSTDPNIVAGDIGQCDSTTSPGGCVLTWGTTGLYSYPGACGSTRQTFTCNFYDVSAGDLHADTMSVCVNNSSPQVVGGATEQFNFVKDQAFTAINLATRFEDADDATLTITTSDTGTGTGTDKRPAGTTITSGSWDDTGAGPTSADASTGTFTVTATDSCGATAEFIAQWSVYQQVSVPDCAGIDVASCDALADAVHLTLSSTFDCSNSIAANDVISQSPTASTVVDPFTSMSVVASNGACTGIQSWTSLYLSDVTAVPAGAVFVEGVALGQDGTHYVAPYPSSGQTFSIRGLKYRSDGALIISTSGAITHYVRGIGLTATGEVKAATCSADYYVAGVPLDPDGTVCMTDVD